MEKKNPQNRDNITDQEAKRQKTITVNLENDLIDKTKGFYFKISKTA